MSLEAGPSIPEMLSETSLDPDDLRCVAAKFRAMAAQSTDLRITPSLLALAEEYEAEALRREPRRAAS